MCYLGKGISPTRSPVFCKRKDSPLAGVTSVTARSKCTSKQGLSLGERVRSARQGDRAVGEVKAIIDAQMVCIRLFSISRASP